VGERWRTVVSIAVVLTMLSSLAHYYYDGHYAKEDVRGAMRYVEKRMETRGDDACVFAPTVFDVARRYRTADYALYRAFQRRWVKKSSVDAQLDPLFAACNSVWYVRAREWVDDYDGYLWRSLRARYHVVEQTQFDGVKVFLMVKDDRDNERI
jgi:hypothetical protein